MSLYRRLGFYLKGPIWSAERFFMRLADGLIFTPYQIYFSGPRMRQEYYFLKGQVSVLREYDEKLKKQNKALEKEIRVLNTIRWKRENSQSV